MSPMRAERLETPPGEIDSIVDRKFGSLIREARHERNLSAERASLMAGIPIDRLRALEHGTASRGATRKECESLSEIYGLNCERLLHKALGEDL